MGDCAQANDLAMIVLDLIIILRVMLKTHLEFFPKDRGDAPGLGVLAFFFLFLL